MANNFEVTFIFSFMPSFVILALVASERNAFIFL